MLAVNKQDSAVTMDSIVIRDLSGSAEFRQMERVQTLAWNRDERSLVPWEFMKIAQFSGAIVVGAFDDQQLIGYAFGIVGTMPHHIKLSTASQNRPAQEQLQMYSHQLAVLPAYQSLGIGRRLKLAQRDFCREHGIDLMTWTFDPLMGRNGWLNLGRLGGITRTFLTDWYGPLQHRFLLEWWLNDEHVEARVEKRDEPLPLHHYLAKGVPIANPVTIDHRGLLIPPDYFNLLTAPQLLVEVPGHVQKIAQQDQLIEQSWRVHIKELLPPYLEAGYVVTDIARENDQTGRRIYYVLSKKS